MTALAQTESLFHTYSQYASMTNIPPKPTDEEQRTESQIRELLDKVPGQPLCLPCLHIIASQVLQQSYTDHVRLQRDALIGQLTRLLDSSADLTSSALKQNNLARHREVLADHRRELSRLKNTISTARDRANLLSDVRSDIDAYRSANPAQAEADYMLDERRRIDNSHNMADSVLSQAYAVNENFGFQRETLASINRRITGAASQVPGLNSLMSRISAKKRRDGVILGSFIAFCFLMLFFFS